MLRRRYNVVGARPLRNTRPRAGGASETTARIERARTVRRSNAAGHARIARAHWSRHAEGLPVAYVTGQCWILLNKV